MTRALIASDARHRHYGALTGLDKQETVDKHGIEQVRFFRERTGCARCRARARVRERGARSPRCR